MHKARVPSPEQGELDEVLPALEGEARKSEVQGQPGLQETST